MFVVLVTPYCRLAYAVTIKAMANLQCSKILWCKFHTGKESSIRASQVKSHTMFLIYTITADVRTWRVCSIGKYLITVYKIKILRYN